MVQFETVANMLNAGKRTRTKTVYVDFGTEQKHNIYT